MVLFEMIPVLDIPLAPLDALQEDALGWLKTHGFAGDVSYDAADRTVFSTDNSIYQAAPGSIVFPKSMNDLLLIARMTALPQFRTLVVRPRGGGTGTNGQSLGDGMMVDVSRHMNKILEINVLEGWARVEAGVVKDQLNAAAAPHGLFFAPELSTSNRATIGGMVSTDASGQGSCLYGKTSDHVLELTVALAGGVPWKTSKLSPEALQSVMARSDIVGHIHRTVHDVVRWNAAEIERHFPKLNRSLSGYDLAHVLDEAGQFDLASVLCGSEGTLALIGAAKLQLLPLPETSAVFVLRYHNFNEALADARHLMQLGAASIETIDSKVLSLARGDGIWDSVAELFPTDEADCQGVNFLEVVGSHAEVDEKCRLLGMQLMKGGNLGFEIARGEQAEHIWTMRKRAVGLLGNVGGERRPIPFVEDTAVPPERLGDFVAEFRACLDRHGLDYGMFGHVDAGVLHVRPMLDLKDPDQESMIREITEETVRLTTRYGGLLWGEHGKGFRSEFVPAVFGPLNHSLKKIKRAFDARNQMNPGKIATPDETELTRLDAVGLRGRQDRQIPSALRTEFDEIMHCNGNGACFNFDVGDAMCPSWKSTRERKHSPKGRSALMREWLRLLRETPEAETLDAGRKPVPRRIADFFGFRLRETPARDNNDFSHQVKEAIDGCLGCKACSGTCPIRVDIPSARSKFLALYHSRYRRPLKDYVIAWLEPILPYAARIPGISNRVMSNILARRLWAWIGIADLPLLTRRTLFKALAREGIDIVSTKSLRSPSLNDPARSVVVVQDAFTSYFDTDVVVDAAVFLKRIGFNVSVAPYLPNGKPRHVLGMLKSFSRIAERNVTMLRSLAATGVAFVGIDPSVTLTYRDEYRKEGLEPPNVRLLQEWLEQNLKVEPSPATGRKMVLFAHCTEQSLAKPAVMAWSRIFSHFGLEIEIARVGCCGMAGTYGHEVRNLAVSRKIYELSWAEAIAHVVPADRLATGFSCRCQIERFDLHRPRHPIQALLEVVGRSEPAAPRAVSDVGL